MEIAPATMAAEMANRARLGKKPDAVWKLSHRPSLVCRLRSSFGSSVGYFAGTLEHFGAAGNTAPRALLVASQLSVSSRVSNAAARSSESANIVGPIQLEAAASQSPMLSGSGRG
jgi:hypothetical protein